MKKIDIKNLAERILNNYSGRIQPNGKPIRISKGTTLYRFGLKDEHGVMVEHNKMHILLDGCGGFTAVIDPDTKRAVKRDGHLEEFDQGANAFHRADEIKVQYLGSGCQAQDVDEAVARLQSECGDLFESAQHAWSFLMEATHEDLETVRIKVSLDDGVTYSQVAGVRIIYKGVPIPGEDGTGELHLNYTREGLISDAWTTRDAQLDHNIGTSSQLIDDMVRQLDGIDDEAAVLEASRPGIDWTLLRQQKAHLVSMASDDDRLTHEIETLDGVIALLDHIQDDAVSNGRATQRAVFGPDWIIYSPNESAVSDGAGFWSNDLGWTTISGVTLFADSEKESMHMPNSTGNDAIWVQWTEAQKQYGEFAENELNRAGIDVLSPAIEHLQTQSRM